MPNESETTSSFPVLFRLLGVIVFGASILGCGQTEIGGGTKGIASGGGSTEAVYGIAEGQKLGFAIFTDIPSDGAVASVGSTWSGAITPQQGKNLEYNGSNDRLNIDGTEYDLANGRVFLVKVNQGDFSVSQLNIPFTDADYRAEFDRIANINEVKAFRGN